MPSAWKDEFDRRCRRLLGVTDDSLPVTVEMDYVWYSTLTGGETSVEVECGRKRRLFPDMGDVIRALDDLPDD